MCGIKPDRIEKSRIICFFEHGFVAFLIGHLSTSKWMRSDPIACCFCYFEFKKDQRYEIQINCGRIYIFWVLNVGRLELLNAPFKVYIWCKRSCLAFPICLLPKFVEFHVEVVGRSNPTERSRNFLISRQSPLISNSRSCQNKSVVVVDYLSHSVKQFFCL